MSMGPPAAEQQLNHIYYLLDKLGCKYINSKCRHEYGMTLREANGGWTMTEASRLIDQLKKDVDE